MKQPYHPQYNSISDIAGEAYTPMSQPQEMPERALDMHSLEGEVESEYLSAKRMYSALAKQRRIEFDEMKKLSYSSNFFINALGPVGRFINYIFKGKNGKLVQMYEKRKKIYELDEQIHRYRKALNYHIHQKIRTAMPHLEKEVRKGKDGHYSTLDIANRYADLIREAQKYMAKTRSSHLGQTYLPFVEPFTFFRMYKLNKVLKEINSMRKKYGHILKHYYQEVNPKEKISRGFFSPIYLFNPLGHIGESYLQYSNLKKTEEQLYQES